MVGCAEPKPETKTPEHGPWVNEQVVVGLQASSSALDVATKALDNTNKTLDRIHAQQGHVKKTLEAVNFSLARLNGIRDRAMEVCSIFIHSKFESGTMPIDELRDKTRIAALCLEIDDLQVEIDQYMQDKKF